MMPVAVMQSVCIQMIQLDFILCQNVIQFIHRGRGKKEGERERDRGKKKLHDNKSIVILYREIDK